MVNLTSVIGSTVARDWLEIDLRSQCQSALDTEK